MKHSMFFVACLTLAGIILSCNPGQKSALAGNETIRTIFNEKEIQDLTIILNFFENQICDLLQVQSDSVTDCYTALFNNMLKAENTGVIYVPVSFPDQLAMYESLSDSAFTQIWLKGKAVNQETGAESVRLTLSFDGKYMQFLDALRNEYTFLEAYRRSFREERKMTSEMIETVMYGSQAYNMQDVRLRLFVALHYLTLNDTYERKNQ